MERTTARPRAGCKALSTDIELENPPVVLDFDLPTGISVSSMTRSSSTVTVTTATDHGFTTGDIVAIEGANETDYNGDWEITVTDTDEFTFSIGSATPATPATGTIVAAKGLRIFDVYEDRIRAACSYTADDNAEGIVRAGMGRAFLYREGESSVELDYPSGETIEETDEADLVPFLDKVFLLRGRAAGPELTLSSLSETAGTATATTSTAHNLANDDWVFIQDSDGVFRGLWQITVTDTDEFTFAITGSPGLASAPGVCWKAKPPLYWDRDPAGSFEYVTTGGPPESLHLRMPPADWALAFNRQLILPFGRDESIMSDFGDPDVYDTQLAQLRIRPGEADWFVAAHPGPLTRLLYLYRKSVHLVYRNSDDLSIDAVHEVTREVGCVARRTVRTCGEFIAWLSDQGVQLAVLGLELQLLTAKRPLSADIQDLIERINWSYADLAVAAYHDNRYWLAVPLDDSQVNNTILVFNFINTAEDAPYGEWESVDRYPGDFDVVALLVLGYQGRQRLHAVSSTGYCYVLNELDQDEYGAPSGDLGSYDIAGIVQGRRHLFGTLREKRLVAIRIDLEMDADSQVAVTLSTLNPDRSHAVASVTAAATDDRTIKRHLRARGTSAAIDISLPVGRPTLRAVELEAAIPGDRKRDEL